jgi:salicylate hydroxylase
MAAIAVAGGGIAGLTAALALAKSGHSIRVFERAKSLEDIGAGLQLSPNAYQILNALGLGGAIRAISFEPEFLHLINGKTGRGLTTLAFKPMMEQRYGAPYLVTHRGDLQGVLLTAARGNPLITFETGVEICRYTETKDSVAVDGQSFDALIVADGVHSALRAQIDPDASVALDGQTAWRATLPIDDLSTNAVRVYMNNGAHLVAYKMGHRAVLNMVFVSSRNQPPDAGGFDGEAKNLINAATDWKAWPLASVQSKNWHGKRAVMIGDAAHAMTPHAAQGGAMAIEDAGVLAGCMKTAPDITGAFAAYQSQRQPRIKRVAGLSAQNRAIYQMDGMMALGRNAVMPFIPSALLLKRLDWLYGWSW